MKTPRDNLIAMTLLAGALLWPTSGQAAFLEGVAAYSRGDFVAAAEIWREDAAAGDAAAQRNLGLLYLNGQGVPKNEVAAVEWFRRSSDQGFPRASANLAEMYLRGIGVPRDPERAVAFYQRAAEGGLAEAQHNLAILIDAGFGVARDPELARRWFQRAAAAGHVPAQEWLRDTASAQTEDAAEDPAPEDSDELLTTTSDPTVAVPARDGGLVDSLHAILSPAG